MNSFIRRTINLKLVIVLAVPPLCLSSCNTPQGNQGLGFIGTALQVGATFVGGDKGKLMFAAGTLISYVATQQQIAQAQKTANEALRRSSVKNALARSGDKYVVVPVDRDRKTQSKGKSSKMVMLVNAKTGEPKGDAFEPTQKAYKEGQEVEVKNRFGLSTKAVVASSFAGI